MATTSLLVENIKPSCGHGDREVPESRMSGAHSCVLRAAEVGSVVILTVTEGHARRLKCTTTTATAATATATARARARATAAAAAATATATLRTIRSLLSSREFELQEP